MEFVETPTAIPEQEGSAGAGPRLESDECADGEQQKKRRYVPANE
jgi:hypothetical protein